MLGVLAALGVVVALLVLGWAGLQSGTLRGVGAVALPTLSPAGALMQADARGQAGLPVQAAYYAQQAGGAEGWPAQAHSRAATAWEAAGDAPRALAHWSAAAAAAPSAATWRAYSAALLRLGRYAEAGDALAALLGHDPHDTWAHAQRGLLLAAFDPAAATVHLRAVALDPAYGDLARAVRRASEETRAAPEPWALPLAVGGVLLVAEEWPIAEVALLHAHQQALAATGQPLAEALALTGVARAYQGKEGAPYVAAAVTLAPQSAPVRVAEGLYLRATNDLVSSRAALAAAVALDPLAVAANAELGVAYGLLDDWVAAAQFLRLAAASAPGDARLAALRDEAEARAASAVILPEGALPPR